MTATLLTGIALGLASSAHCAAMCGPLVLAVGAGAPQRSRRGRVGHALLHQAGRVATYGLLALPAGLAGEALATRGFGRAVAIAGGIVLLAAAAGSSGVARRSRIAPAASAMIARLSATAFRWAHAHPSAGPLLIGALNGLLPCGLVYAALAAAIATGGTLSAAVLMLGFGIGTSAILLAIASGTAALSPSLRLRLRPLGRIVLVATAAILIARGTLPSHQHQSTAAAHHVHE